MRFYFDLECEEAIIRDEEGIEAADLVEGLGAAQDVLAELRESGELPAVEEGWQMLIRGDEGAVLATLPVR